MKITIETPTKAYIENPTTSLIEDLKRQLTYSNTSISFLLQKLSKNKWLRQNRPHTYQQKYNELKEKLNTCLLQQDTKGYFFYPGYISYIDTASNIEVVNNIKYPQIKKYPWAKPLPFELYNYQKESVERLIKAKHGHVSLATGTGKSAIILTLARELGLKIAVVTPSKSIFSEMLKNFEKHLGKGLVGAYGAGKKKIGKNITICVAKSLTTLKPGSKEYEFFANKDVMLIDESHTFGADTLEAVCHGVLQNVPYRFFLSGTQVRGDGKDKLLHSIIGPEQYNLPTKKAIEGGYICPVNFTVMKITKDPISNKNTKKEITDPLEVKREYFLYNKDIANLAAKISNTAWKYAQESTLILVEELSQIALLTKLLTVPYDYVHAGSKAEAISFGLEPKDVDSVVEDFNRGKIKVLIGTSCISTGTNIFPTHNTINWVGGSSEVKTKQGAIGRSVRVLQTSIYKDFHKEKPISKIFDFDINNVILKKQLNKRIGMYKEVNNNIRYLVV